MNDGLFSFMYIDPPTTVGGSVQYAENTNWKYFKKQMPKLINFIVNHVALPVVMTYFTYKRFQWFQNWATELIKCIYPDTETITLLTNAKSMTYIFVSWAKNSYRVFDETFPSSTVAFLCNKILSSP
jgi:hypothetical protein